MGYPYVCLSAANAPYFNSHTTYIATVTSYSYNSCDFIILYKYVANAYTYI